MENTEKKALINRVATQLDELFYDEEQIKNSLEDGDAFRHPRSLYSHSARS